MRYIIYILLPAFIFTNYNLSFSQKIKIDSREIVINYEDSTLKAEVSFKEIKYKPKNNLVYYWYKSNEVKKNLGGYSGQLLNGKYSVYDIENNLITQGYFKNGIKTGIWKKWITKGGLQKIEEYKKGKKDGRFVNYLPSGHIYNIMNYTKGKLHGKYTEYSADTISLEKKYRKGVEIIPKEKKVIAEKEDDENKKEKEKKIRTVKLEEVKKEVLKDIQKETKEEKQLRKEKEREEKALEKEKKKAEKEKLKSEKLNKDTKEEHYED